MLYLVGILLILTCFIGQGSARTCVCGAPSKGGPVDVDSCGGKRCGAIGSIKPGECYDHLATQGSWFKIGYNEQTGYARKDYLSGPQSCKTSEQQCVPPLCSEFSSNDKRGCDQQGCGNYGASRGVRKHQGWDIKCNARATVYAPFDGVITRKAPPYKYKSCRNTGFQIEGKGEYAGHVVKIFYVEPTIKIPSKVTRGQAVATHIGMYCDNSMPNITDHIHYELVLNGVRVDPASYIFCN